MGAAHFEFFFENESDNMSSLYLKIDPIFLLATV